MTTMAKVSFNCEEASVDLFVQVLSKLENIKGSRKIRIGGSEYTFYGVDNVSDISVDDVLYCKMAAMDQRALSALRSRSIPIAAPANVLAPITNTVASVADDSDTDDELEIDEPCGDCGTYVSPKNLDSKGYCCDCSVEDTDSAPSTNLSTDDATAVRNELVDYTRMTRIFTAFDITRNIRRNGIRCNHEDVKQIVHNMYEVGGMSGYSRSLVDVGRNVRPWLYCPDSRDSSEYDHGDN